MRKSLSNSDLKKILETTNERDLFMVGHIYIENTIDRILEKRFNMKILKHARLMRIHTRGKGVCGQVISALRNQFGGHAVEKAKEK